MLKLISMRGSGFWRRCHVISPPPPPLFTKWGQPTRNLGLGTQKIAATDADGTIEFEEWRDRDKVCGEGYSRLTEDEAEGCAQAQKSNMIFGITTGFYGDGRWKSKFPAAYKGVGGSY